MRRPSPQKAMMGNYAAVPGSGPADEICLHCTHLSRDACRFSCSQYLTITKRQGRAISPQTPACRYFEKKVKA